MISDAEIPPVEKIGIPQVLEVAVTTGLKQFAGVGDGRKIQVHRNGISFVGQMHYEQWIEALATWKRVSEVYHFGLADFINYGRERFGAQKVQGALTQLDFDLADVMKAEAIGQSTLDLRLVSLTSEHYYVLGRLLPEGKQEQGKWAALAEKHELSALELKKSIEAGKVIKQPEIDQTSGRNSGITNIEGLTLMFERWERQVGGEEKILHDWNDDLKRLWLEKVRPIVELAVKVERTLQ